MNKIDEITKEELKQRKEILNEHLNKFNRLKSEGKWSEAWNQLLITLNYANETLAHSANILKNLSQKMPGLEKGNSESVSHLCGDTIMKKDCKKIIVIPKKQNIH